MSDICARFTAFLNVSTDLKQNDEDHVIFPKDPQGWVAALKHQAEDDGYITVRVETENDGGGRTFVAFCSDQWTDDFNRFVCDGGAFGLILSVENLRKLGEMFLFAAKHNPAIGE